MRSCTDSYSTLILDDPTVSNQHLRIYSILYDPESDSNIAPMVYAEDLSRNGTYWNGVFIGKSNGGILISDGDRLRISPRLSFIYHGTSPPKDEALSDAQATEAQVVCVPIDCPEY